MRYLIKKHSFFFFFMAVAFSAAVLPSMSAHANDEIVFVVHKGNPINKLTGQEIKSIFLGKKRTWENSESITLVVQENNKTHETFTRNALVKSPLQFSIYWKKKLFTGKGLLPHAVKNDQKMINFITSNPNSIGYIKKTSLTGVVKDIVIH